MNLSCIVNDCELVSNREQVPRKSDKVVEIGASESSSNEEKSIVIKTKEVSAKVKSVNSCESPVVSNVNREEIDHESPATDKSMSFDTTTSSILDFLRKHSEGEVCESPSCESSESSIMKFNSTTSSYLENIDEYMVETAKLKDETEKIQWMSYSLENVWSVNDIMDKLWLYVNGNWKFESNMSQKLSEKLGFDVVKRLWLAMKSDDDLVNKVAGIKRKAELSPAKLGCENSPISRESVKPASPNLDQIV